jgi:hypothetical protein
MIQLPTAAQPIEEQFITEVPTGFVQIWQGASKTQADAIVILITTFTTITAEIIMIGAYIHFHHFFRSFISSKRQPYYHYFWAVQVLVVAILFFFQPVYLRDKQHNIAIVPYIYLISIFIDFGFAFGVCCYLSCWSRDGLLPVPLSMLPCCLCHCCPCCAKVVTNNTACCLQDPVCALTCHILSKDKQSVEDETPRTLCSYIYLFLMNLVCHTLTFFLVSYVVQSLPNILIAYYAYPTRSLVRLSFIQISLVCLLLSVATLIYLLETLSWQCYICYYKKAPTETEQFDSVKDIEFEESNSRTIQTTETQDGGVLVNMDQNEAEPHKKASIVLKKPLKSICTTIAQIIAIIMILVALSIVLVIIGTIVFKQTEDNDTLKGLLTILPTVLGNVIIYVTKSKLLHPSDFKFKVKLKNN